jgi:hypothetical protein
LRSLAAPRYSGFVLAPRVGVRLTAKRRRVHRVDPRVAGLPVSVGA